MFRDVVVKKGTNPEIDSYSAFADNNQTSLTELYTILDKHQITDVYVCGMLVKKMSKGREGTIS